MREPSRSFRERAAPRSWCTGAIALLGLAIFGFAAPAQAQSVLGLLANSMNAELPRSFGNHTRLMKVTANGNTLGFDFEVAPQSPLARGLDVKAQAASLCRVEMFRQIMTSARARLHVTYYRPDRTPLGDFTIDKSICRS